jgi:putative drug exporter of the RND superfamily
VTDDDGPTGDTVDGGRLRPSTAASDDCSLFGMRIGPTIFRFRWQIVALWLVALAALLLFVPQADPAAGLTRDLLPADSPYYRALDEYAERFGDKSGKSEIVVLLERSDASLTPRDLSDAEEIGRRLTEPGGGQDSTLLRDTTLRTPKSLESLGTRNPLISADRRAAMVCLFLPCKDTSADAVRMVDRVHAVVDDYPLAAGLRTAISGSAGFCRDYLLAHERSHDKTLMVTVVAVIVVLLLVYRAPLAAAIPLAAIGILTAITTKLTILGQGVGLSTGTAERLFMLLLLFGAGVDYSLLFISRYKEYLGAGRPTKKAFILALDTSFGAIAASAATTAAGLATLCLARLGVLRDVGPAIVLALLAAGFASLSLVPAMVAIFGPKLFWPRERAKRRGRAKLLLCRSSAGTSPSQGCSGALRQDTRWESLADVVTRRPALVLLLTLAVLAWPALRGATLSWSYDAHSSLPARYSASRGMDIVQRHWSTGEISQARVLVVSPCSQPVQEWISTSGKILSDLRGTAGLSDLRGLTAPLGLSEGGLANFAALLLGRSEVQSHFISPDRRAMWFSATLEDAPQSPEAMDCVDRIRSATQQTLANAALPAQVHLSGATAETMDIRSVTQSDFRRLTILSLSVILLIVAALLRDVLLSVFMVASTVAGYLATLGVTAWVFSLLGSGGLDWEVEVFLFIVMVAVGQDYNLFFAVRLAQESHSPDVAHDTPGGPTALERVGVSGVSGVAAATSRALVHTGRVISSCGVIMAATLGSMVVGEIKMLQQLGFALGLGMLIDTFVVRPLLLPSFIVLTRRTISKAARFLRPPVE